MPLVAPAEPVPVAELGAVHFVGIGGAGMSGIARIMLSRGVPVSGCDAQHSPVLDELGALGAAVHVGHDAAHLAGSDTLVVSTAIRQGNPELAGARARGMRILHRATALASVMLGRRGIAVAGTHGKTTTSSMLTTALMRCGAAPGYIIGGVLVSSGLGASDGAGELLVAEADESDGSFLQLAPDAAIVTNIEPDHLDNYATLADIAAAFEAFAGRIRPGGLLVTCRDDPGARALAAAASRLDVRLRTYGEAADADYRVTDVTPQGMGVSFEMHAAQRQPFGIKLGVPGRHNALNAAAAVAVAVELGFPSALAAEGLAGFRGARRRMELKGEADGVRVLDSYAHHPTEVAADLRSARDIASGEGRVIAVFQPHLYSRTRIFAADLGTALGLADEALVLDVYAAREDPEPGVTGRLVADAVPGGRAQFVADTSAVPGIVAGIAKPGDLVLTMGAGSVTALGPVIVAALRTRPAGGQR
ncbi:MAG: UDP-N-acetylmuramate--L-alanine ligase [Micromonosporaceae bacterium]